MDRVYIMSRYRATTEKEQEFNREASRLGIHGRIMTMSRQQIKEAMKVVV